MFYVWNQIYWVVSKPSHLCKQIMYWSCVIRHAMLGVVCKYWWRFSFSSVCNEVRKNEKAKAHCLKFVKPSWALCAHINEVQVAWIHMDIHGHESICCRVKFSRSNKPCCICEGLCSWSSCHGQRWNNGQDVTETDKTKHGTFRNTVLHDRFIETEGVQMTTLHHVPVEALWWHPGQRRQSKPFR